MKKGSAILIAFLAGVWLAAAAAQAATVDRIVAVVNNDIITENELESAFALVRKRIEASYKGPDMEKVIAESRLQVLSRMIDGKLIEQRAARQGLTVRDEDVMATIKDLLGKRNIQMEDFLKTLEREGSNFDAYKREIRDQMIRMRLLRREVRLGILVTDEEIGDYYVKNREDYEGKESFRIKQILLLAPEHQDRARRTKRLSEAAQIRKRLKDGESFDLLAAQFSQGPAAASGGDIGFVEAGTMLPEVDREAAKLKIDEISEVIASPVGFHIIKVLDKRGGGNKPIETIREEIKTKLEDEKMEKKYEQWIADLRKQSRIEIKSVTAP